MRGRSHQLACGVAAAAGCIMYRQAPEGRAAWSVLVYTLALVALFGISATYHRIHWTTPQARLRMRRLDHAAIYLLIAGTYTPICLLSLRPPVDRQILSLVWGGAVLGILKTLLWPNAPKVLSTLLYVILGSSLVPHLLASSDQMSDLARNLLLTGGAVYTIGSLIYAAKRPNPAPRVFGYHEIFHLLVIGAAGCHFAAIYAML
jgi:hemolysin III